MKKYLLLLSSFFLLSACSTPSETSISGTCEHKGVAYDQGESYFDGCNWHTCQEKGFFVGTEMACEPKGDPIYKGDAGYEDAMEAN